MWCLREAKQARDRFFLKRAVSIALHQDAAGRRLLVRFRAADSELNVRTGVLGHVHYLKYGSGAEALIKSTKAVVRKFCTLNDGAPHRNNRKEGDVVVDSKLERHIRDHVEAYGASSSSEGL